MLSSYSLFLPSQNYSPSLLLSILTPFFYPHKFILPLFFILFSCPLFLPSQNYTPSLFFTYFSNHLKIIAPLPLSFFSFHLTPHLLLPRYSLHIYLLSSPLPSLLSSLTLRNSLSTSLLSTLLSTLYSTLYLFPAPLLCLFFSFPSSLNLYKPYPSQYPSLHPLTPHPTLHPVYPHFSRPISLPLSPLPFLSPQLSTPRKAKPPKGYSCPLF